MINWMLLTTADQEADNTDSEACEEKECSVVIDRVVTAHLHSGGLTGRLVWGGETRGGQGTLVLTTNYQR